MMAPGLPMPLDGRSMSPGLVQAHRHSQQALSPALQVQCHQANQDYQAKCQLATAGLQWHATRQAKQELAASQQHHIDQLAATQMHEWAPAEQRAVLAQRQAGQQAGQRQAEQRAEQQVAAHAVVNEKKLIEDSLRKEKESLRAAVEEACQRDSSRREQRAAEEAIARDTQRAAEEAAVRKAAEEAAESARKAVMIKQRQEYIRQQEALQLARQTQAADAARPVSPATTEEEAIRRCREEQRATRKAARELALNNSLAARRSASRSPSIEQL